MRDIKTNKTLEGLLYAAPSIEVVEIAAQNVICQSGGLEDATRYEGTWEE